MSSEPEEATAEVPSEEAPGNELAPITIDQADDIPDTGTFNDLPIDIQALQDTIRGFTRPPALWEDTDGVGGALAPYMPGLSLVIRQSPIVHREVESVLAELGRRPRVDDSPMPTPKKSFYSSIHDLISTMTRPPALWQHDDGEGGSIGAHLATGSLVISQSNAVHEEIYSLLTQLRRSTTASKSGQGIWTLHQLAHSHWPITEITPAEIDALRIRKPSSNGNWLHVSNGATEAVAFESQEGTLKAKLGAMQFTVDGATVRLLWPRVNLVEASKDVSAAKQQLDLALPWLPHRSNKELATMFDVSVEKRTKEVVTLRLTIDGGNQNYALAEYSIDSGELRAWSVYSNARRAYRLRVKNSETTVVFPELADEKWTASSKAARFEKRTDSYVLHQQPGNGARKAPPFTQMLIEMNSGRIERALGQAELVLNAHPKHALTSFFKAQCRDLLPRAMRRSDAVLALRAAAQNRGVNRWIAGTHFEFLMADERFELLKTLPEEQRTDADRETLVRAALNAEQPAAAIELLDSISNQDSPVAIRLRLHALMDLEKNDQAAALIKRVSASKHGTSYLLELASFLRDRDEPELTETILSAILKRHPEKVPNDVLRHVAHRSSYPQSAERFFKLAEQLPNNDAVRDPARRELVMCFSHSAHAVKAMMLARDCEDGKTKVDLVARAAHLGAGDAAVARMMLPVLRSGDVMDYQLDWLINRLYYHSGSIAAEKLIDAAHARIRSGRTVTKKFYEILRNAYIRAGRGDEASRASSQSEIEKKKNLYSGGGSGLF